MGGNREGNKAAQNGRDLKGIFTREDVTEMVCL